MPAKHEHYSVYGALLTGVLFIFVSLRRGDRYIIERKRATASPLEKGSSPAKYLASVHDSGPKPTSVGCTDGCASRSSIGTGTLPIRRTY